MVFPLRCGVPHQGGSGYTAIRIMFHQRRLTERCRQRGSGFVGAQWLSCGICQDLDISRLEEHCAVRFSPTPEGKVPSTK
jgi:hypothetical protein